MRLGTLAFVVALAACSSSTEEPAPGGATDSGTTDGSASDVAADTNAGGGDTSAPSDSAAPTDTGGGADAAPVDAAGVTCGDTVCAVGQVCCVTPSGSSLSFKCDSSCPDAGGTIACDGPEDCSSGAPICCADVEVTGTFPSCAFKTGDASCKTSCTTNLPTTCPAKATVRACKKEADCTEPSFKNCCEFTDGTNSATFCAPDYMLSFATVCF